MPAPVATVIELDQLPSAMVMPPLTTTAETRGETPAPETGEFSLVQYSVVVAAVTGINVASGMTRGILAIALPKMADDLGIPDYLILWPASVYGLTTGCSLLIAGAIADVVGGRVVYLVGCLLLALSVLASGLAQTAAQLIVFRVFQGIASSCCLPTAVSILSETFVEGRRRQVGFALLGLGQPLGYSIGLLLTGFFVDSVGWRYVWYLCSAMAFVIFVAAIWALPATSRRDPLNWKTFIQKFDFVGVAIASACLGMLSYVLAMVSEGSSRIRDPQNIALLCIAVVLMPSFVVWMDFRVKNNKPALIPNSLWSNTPFSSVCLLLFITWAVVNTVEYYFSFFFQKVQMLSALQASIRFLPNIMLGFLVTIVIGMIAHKYSAYWIILSMCLVSGLSPLLLAITNPGWSYWYTLFWAMLLSPVAACILFVVSNLVITEVFPVTTQALAGAVFNTICQFGAAVGLAVMTAISSSVTAQSEASNKNSPDALLEGYRASFWACCGAVLLSLGIGLFGLRDVGKVGLKRE